MNMRLFLLLFLLPFVALQGSASNFTFAQGGNPVCAPNGLVGLGTPIRIYDQSVNGGKTAVGELSYQIQEKTFIDFFIKRAKRATIWNLYVDPKSQNKGYGSALMQHAQQYLTDQGFDEIALIPGPFDKHKTLSEQEIEERLPKLKAFYTKNGFCPEDAENHENKFWVYTPTGKPYKATIKKQTYLLGALIMGGAIYKWRDKINAFFDRLSKKNNKKDEPHPLNQGGEAVPAK